MNRQMMKHYLGKWLKELWDKIPAESRKPAIDAFMAGYEKGYAQHKLETSWRSIDK